MIHGSGLGYRRDLAQDFVNLAQNYPNNPIDFIEVAPENWLKMGGQARKLFDQAAANIPVVIHGLSLSLGGQAPLDRELLSGIKSMMKQYDTQFFSDHLSYCQDHCGGHLYDLLPIPFTDDSIRYTAQRIDMVQDFLGCQIAIENTSYYLHSPLAEMDEVEFLNAVARESNCLIHLDVNNIYVNAVNHGLLKPRDFLNRVDGARVAYIHIAGHDDENPELLIDTHGEKVQDNVWDLLSYTYEVLPHIPPTLLERDFNFPPFGELLEEVQKIKDFQIFSNKQQRYVA